MEPFSKNQSVQSIAGLVITFRHMVSPRKPHLGKSIFIIRVVKKPILSSAILKKVIIISNRVISKTPSTAVIGTITSSETRRRASSPNRRTWDLSRSLKWSLPWHKAPCPTQNKSKSPSDNRTWRNWHVLGLVTLNGRILN